MKPKDYAKTLLPIALMLFLTLQKGTGFILIVLAVPFLTYALYSGFRMLRRPDERRSRCLKLAAWGVAFALAAAALGYRSVSSRRDAEAAVEKVLAYKLRTGAYPAALKDLGVDDARLLVKWGLRYEVKQHAPSLTYPAVVMPLALHEYDFEARRWRQNAY